MKFPILDQTNWSGRIPSRLKLFIMLYCSLFLVQALLLSINFRTEWKHRSTLLANSLENNIVTEEGQIFQGPEGEEQGYLILNYRGELLFDHLRESETLLNHNGIETTMPSDDPDLRSKISSFQSGQFRHNGDLYFSRTIRLKGMLAPLFPTMPVSAGVPCLKSLSLRRM
ncbi:MAG: hypothetical protein B6241_14380 [Spirochaetaceae bacterium 4572_59]|nr:MAG: hypothetical protein B6241_14380 [Spirochaetaceae bacterium 4572_59]